MYSFKIQFICDSKFWPRASCEIQFNQVKGPAWKLARVNEASTLNIEIDLILKLKIPILFYELVVGLSNDKFL